MININFHLKNKFVTRSRVRSRLVTIQVPEAPHEHPPPTPASQREKKENNRGTHGLGKKLNQLGWKEEQSNTMETKRYKPIWNPTPSGNGSHHHHH